ncbi:MAG: cytochrome c oxidase assembly protein, partial [Actinomycetota bacterium]|nr:cytochrome c oxidase assembly protein [Actinomycetota bacterium]
TVATAPPLAGAAERRFSAHVAQHVLLGMVAPLLLALGTPVALLVQSVSPRRRAPILSALRGAGAVLNPFTGWVVFVASLFVLYFSPLYRLSLDHEVIHHAVHVHFLVAGLVYFVPVLGVDPLPHPLSHGARALSLALAVPVHGFLGVALMSSSQASLSGGAGAAALADQRLGGGLMWLLGDVVMLAALAVVVVQWMRADERVAAREDRCAARRPPFPST